VGLASHRERKNSDTVDATETLNPITVDGSEDNHVSNGGENACDCGFHFWKQKRVAARFQPWYRKPSTSSALRKPLRISRHATPAEPQISFHEIVARHSIPQTAQ
jgi:hypothetical protein